jgi:aspartate-semialdehyde dehydrogenase
MNRYNIAIVGAAGAVGKEIIKILEERNFPINELRLFATEKSCGTNIPFKGRNIEVTRICENSFDDIDFALFSAGTEASTNHTPLAVNSGAIVIDNSNAFRMETGVPLVVPEVNPQDAFIHKGIIANPNCSTIQMVVALKPIYDKVGIKRIIVSTYQSVSGTGKRAIEELEHQAKAVLNSEQITTEIYPHQIAFNVLPHIDVFEENGYTREEMKMVNETKKILGDDEIFVNATCVRVPVITGHAESVFVETKEDCSLEDFKETLNNFPGVKTIVGANLYPMPINTENDDDILVGRIRKFKECEFNLWIVANNLRKGAALNAVQIAELLLSRNDS